MKRGTRTLAAVGLSAAALLFFASARFDPRAGAGAQGDEGRRREAREEAYRANNLGVALLEQFNHREGAEQFRRALALDPTLALARVNLAVALFNVPDAEAAEREAETAAAAAPAAPQPHYILGLIAKQQNRTEDAIASFLRVLKVDPRDPGVNVNLGQLYAQQRKYDEAMAAFRVALAEEPYNGTALYNLGTSLLRAGRREEGQAVMQRFQALRQSGAATSIGANYLEQGRYAEAVTSTGAEAGLVDKALPEVAFTDDTAQIFPAAPRTTTDAPPPRRATPAPTPRTKPAPASARGARRGRGSSSATKSAANRSNADASDARAAGGAASAVNDSYDVQLKVFPTGAHALFDFDGDGDLDLFATESAVARLYRNDAGRFVDATAAAGALAQAGVALAAVAGDFDNDERPDLFVALPGALRLYRNEGGGRFADVTTAARLPAYPHLAQAAALLDADHDGDLDIFVAGLADVSKSAVASAVVGAPNLLARNNGDGTFADATEAANLKGDGRAAVAVVPTDYDNRRDVDLLVVGHGRAPQLYRNQRDGSFRDVGREVGLTSARAYTCAAAGDVNKDGFTDFFLGARGGAGLLALSDGRGRFDASDAPAAVADASAAQFLDYDNDGLLDLVAVSAAGVLRVLRNVGDGWQDASARASGAGLASALAAPGGVAAGPLASGDVDGDGDVDLLARAPAGRLVFARNGGDARHRSLRVRLMGKVSNRGGVGAKIEVRAGSLWQKLETYAASPAPAPADIVLGLGRRAQADAVRVIWPAGIVQSETETGAGVFAASANDAKPAAKARGLTITELDRKPSSCPYLYAWNGERFEFVTDFMGGGELGYWAAPGVRAAPDPTEYVRVRGDQLKEKNGRYELRVTNELEEALFIDRLQLLSVAHPAGVEVHPNEGLGNPTSARLRLYAARGARPPRAARDEAGRDLLPRLAALDRRYADGFKLHRLRGYADEHALELDLGNDEVGTMNDEVKTRSSIRRSSARRSSVHHSSFIAHRSAPPLVLLLTGWTDYAFSSDNVAAAQHGRTLRPPALQVRDERGRWRTVIKNIGIPVGRPQTVAVDLRGKFLSASREVRVVTNMRIYWDQALVAEAGHFNLRTERLEAVSAELRWRGFSAEVTPDGREPSGYDYARVSHLSPWKTMTGRYTREGDVRELLAATDDIFVVSRTGDELALSFDATALAPLPAGWTRTFLLYSDGFSKEMDLNSASPDAVAPLPFHAMREYPYQSPARYPATPARRAYLERYNTRVVKAPLRRLEATLAGRK